MCSSDLGYKTTQECFTLLTGEQTDTLKVTSAKRRKSGEVREFDVGKFTTPSLAELRKRGQAVAGQVAGNVTVRHEASADVFAYHGQSSGALFQV